MVGGAPRGTAGSRIVAYIVKAFSIVFGSILLFEGASWVSRALPSGLLAPRSLEVALAFVGAVIPLFGVSYAYPAIVASLGLLAYAWGVKPVNLPALVAVSLIVSAADFYSSRLLRARSFKAARASLTGWALLVALPMGALGVSSLAMVALDVTFVKSLLSVVTRMPYTLREFYTVLLSTRLGLAALVAVVVAVAVRAVYWVVSPLLEAATANPRSALSELRSLLASEIESGIIGGGEAERYIAAAASSFLSLLLLPLIAALASLVKELVPIQGSLGGLVAVILSIAVYALSWDILRIASKRIAPKGYADIEAAESRAGPLPSGDPALAALKAAGRRVALGVAASLIAGLVIVAVLYIIEGGLGYPTLIQGLKAALHRQPVGGLPAVLEAYARSYDRYLSNYIHSLDSLLATLIRLLWGH